MRTDGGFWPGPVTVTSILYVAPGVTAKGGRWKENA